MRDSIGPLTNAWSGCELNRSRRERPDIVRYVPVGNPRLFAIDPRVAEIKPGPAADYSREVAAVSEERARMSKFAVLVALLALCGAGVAQAQDSGDAKVEELRAKLRALNWVRGTREISIAGNSTLSLPEGYVYLDAANTAKFEELNQNLSGGKEVMIAPKTLRWSAYLIFGDEGYVKDNEKIDADAILKTLKENTEASNAERKRRGWPELHVVGWSIPPAYNATTSVSSGLPRFSLRVTRP